MAEPQFSDKFIGFVDILGFTAMVQAAEAGSGPSLAEILKLAKCLGTDADRREFQRSGPISCPDAQRIRKDMDFQITQVSDCVIVSAELSPAGVINLIWHCWGACMKLLGEGVMCRGYIKRGSIYHDGQNFAGTGYVDSLNHEKNVSVFKQDANERGTPFIEVGSEVVNYINTCGDVCVKEMFGRMAKSDGELTALFPFQVFVHNWGGFKGQCCGGKGACRDPTAADQAHASEREPAG
jgi:hypothetical protein